MAQRTLGIVNVHAAGIDVGSETIFVAAGDDPVKQFGTDTGSYHAAIGYLRQQGISTVAMEATGVYWIALYELLEEAKIEVYVVNSAYVKHLPGRKSDVADCQWLQQLHAHGLLRQSFIPPDHIRQLRSYVRLRTDHISMAAQHIQHMQKALDLMNIKLHTVISQINGATGMRVIKAIVAGERSPERLLALCDVSIRTRKEKEVLASLRGNYRREHLFSLQQAIECWEFYQHQIKACDREIERLLKDLTDNLPDPGDTGPIKPIRHHRPEIDDLHTKLMKLTRGHNPAAMTGLTDLTLMQLLAEVGTDLSHWKTEKQFTAWLGLAPSMHQSGKSNKKRRHSINTRAGQIFRVAAQSLAGSKHAALGAFYRRIKARRGAMVAMKATARKLAVIFYNVLTKGIHFVEQGLLRYQQQYEAQLRQRLQKQAQRLGLALVPLTSVH